MPEMNSIIRKPHLNVRDSGWETVQKWLKRPSKLFDVVKVGDTEWIYKSC